MRYKIYEIIKPEFLEKKEYEGYYLKTLERIVLQEMDYYSDLNNDFTSPEEAFNAIKKHYGKDSNTSKEMLILPVVKVSYADVY